MNKNTQHLIVIAFSNMRFLKKFQNCYDNHWDFFFQSNDVWINFKNSKLFNSPCEIRKAPNFYSNQIII